VKSDQAADGESVQMREMIKPAAQSYSMCVSKTTNNERYNANRAPNDEKAVPNCVSSCMTPL
jgi:hypothetical protein